MWLPWGQEGEQKNWSRLKGKWAWWALAPISQIPTDQKQIHLPPLRRNPIFKEGVSEEYLQKENRGGFHKLNHGANPNLILKIKEEQLCNLSSEGERCKHS